MGDDKGRKPIVQELVEEPSDYYVQGNDTFWLNVTGDDFDGDIFRYEWRSNRQGTLACNTAECIFDPSDLSSGVHEIRVYADSSNAVDVSLSVLTGVS